MLLQMMMLVGAANALRFGSEIIGGTPEERANALLALVRAENVTSHPNRFSNDDVAAALAVIDARDKQVEAVMAKRGVPAEYKGMTSWLSDDPASDARGDVARDQHEREMKWALAVLDDDEASTLDLARANLVLGAGS